MNITDADSIIAYAKTLWLGWKPDQCDFDSWHRLLAKINSPDLARIAMRELKDNTDWNSPKRAQFLSLLPRTTAPAQEQHEASRKGNPGMYIQCVALDDKGRGHLGDFKTLWWPRDDVVPEQHRLLAIMETFRADHERMYGGTWQLVRSMQGPVTEAEMMSRMHQLRGTIPFDDQQAGKQPDVEYRGTPTRENSRAVPVRQAVADFMASVAIKHEGPPNAP